MVVKEQKASLACCSMGGCKALPYWSCWWQEAAGLGPEQQAKRAGMASKGDSSELTTQVPSPSSLQHGCPRRCTAQGLGLAEDRAGSDRALELPLLQEEWRRLCQPAPTYRHMPRAEQRHARLTHHPSKPARMRTDSVIPAAHSDTSTPPLATSCPCMLCTATGSKGWWLGRGTQGCRHSLLTPQGASRAHFCFSRCF